MCHTNSDPAVGIHQHFLSQGLMPSSFNDRRTVSSETLSTTPCSTNLAANSCVVHFLRPAGGTPRANDIKIASPSSFSFLGRPHRCRSLSAPSRFPSTNRWRVRWTVGTLVCRTSAISRSILEVDPILWTTKRSKEMKLSHRGEALCHLKKGRNDRKTALPPFLDWANE